MALQRMVKAAIILAAFPFISVTGLAGNKLQNCLATKAAEINSLRSERRRIEKKIAAMNLSEAGIQVDSGACTLRALRLGIIAGLVKDYEKSVGITNTANCYALRIHQITQNCFCMAQGTSYDATVEDRYIAEHSRLVAVQKRLLSQGFSNKFIAKHAENMLDASTCINRMALSELIRIEKLLSSPFPPAEVSDMDTGASSATVSQMDTGTGRATKSAMNTGAKSNSVSRKKNPRQASQRSVQYSNQNNSTSDALSDGIDILISGTSLVSQFLSFSNQFNTSRTLSEPRYSTYQQNYTFTHSRRPQSDITGLGTN